MKNFTVPIILGIVFIGVMIFLSSSSPKSSSSESSNPSSTNSAQDVGFNVSGVRIPSYIEFAGEEVPLSDWDVRERLDRELLVNTYWHSNTIRLMKLANRYFPMIEEILRENGIPEDFKYVALVESGLQTVGSPAGAKGYWQFLKSTGQEYGLIINSEVDERYHLEKSTKAACKYIKKAQGKFGSYTMAAASFNMGMNGLRKQKERQKSDRYYDLLLNDETSRYVFRILAFKEIFQNPTAYGFSIPNSELYPPFNYYEVDVSGAIPSMADFASKYGLSYKTLKVLNPWLRENKLTNSSKKTYKVKIPN